MNRTIEALFDSALCRSPAQLVSHWWASRRLTVLAYHDISAPRQFEEHLNYLAAEMHPVTLEQVISTLNGRQALPERAVLITFDDGHRSVFDTAMPMLRDRSVPAVVFVIAGLLDTQRPPWWVEVKELAHRGGKVRKLSGLSPENLVRALKGVDNDMRLAAIEELRKTASASPPSLPQLRPEELPILESAGIAIGNHTLTHPSLPRCSDQKIKDEIRQAHHTLAEALGHSPRAFAYPGGDVDERAVQALKGLGYEAAFLFDHRLSSLPPPDPLRISRVRVNSHTSLNRFKIILSGLHPAIHHLMGRK